ncbi:MAG: hypothetical protein HY905_08555 [Deltaproteobacteria bacterium]|nr:hypothetical protein [Deltaproteobacteria bacterium]
MLRRLQLFEFNDLEATPPALRETIVEALGRALRWGRVLRGLVGPFREFLAASGADEVLDLCSGTGAPAGILIDELQRAGILPPRFLLTDRFPHPEDWEKAAAAHPGSVSFEPTPVDATCIPVRLARGRARVVINALHHFPPPLVRDILADAVEGSSGIFVSEAFSRNPLEFLPMAPAGLVALAVNPLLAHRRRAAKALVTWATPVALLACGWDGFASTLRIHTEAELRAMVDPFGGRFRWEFRSYSYPVLGCGTCFFGVPR